MDETSQPLLSVIIPTKNEERHLPACLESAAQQDCTQPWELIVVDSSCTAACGEIAQRYGARLICEPRPGKGLALVRGSQAATGEILCFTEADCRLPTSWLRTIAGEFEKHPQAVALSGLYTYFDCEKWYNLLCRMALPASAWLFYLLQRNHTIRGTNFAVRRWAYWQAGGVNPQACEMQDVELGLRLAQLGQIRLVPALRIQTSSRRVRRRMLRFIGESWPAIFRVVVRRQVLTRPSYEDIR